MNSSLESKPISVLYLVLIFFLFSIKPTLADSSNKPYTFGPGMPRLSVGLGVPWNIDPSTDRSILMDATFGFRIIGSRKHTPPPHPGVGWRITPEIGYQFKRDTVDNQKKYLRVLRSGLSWFYVFSKKDIGIGTSSSFLFGKYSGVKGMGLRNGIHLGLLDIFVFDISYIWINLKSEKSMHAICFSLNIDVLTSLVLMVGSFLVGWEPG